MKELTLTPEGELSLDNAPQWLARLEPLWAAPTAPRRVHVDLGGVTFIWPSAIALLASAILRLRQLHAGTPPTLSRPRSNSVDTYLNRIGFYELVGQPVAYPWRRHDPGGRFLPVVQAKTEREGEENVREVLEILRQNLEAVGAIYDALQYALLEVVNNVFHHARSPTHAVLCAQSYPRQQRVELAVADTGRGIPASLRDNPALRGKFRTAAEAVRLAVQPRVTGRPEHNTGEGLFFTVEFVKRNGGDAHIHSRDGALWIRAGQERAGPGPFWPGTWVALRFRTDRPVDTGEIFSRYAPPEADYEWLFDEETAF